MRNHAGLYSELHLHLGGAILPHILYVRLQRDRHPLLKRFPTPEKFERFFARKRHGLGDYVTHLYFSDERVVLHGRIRFVRPGTDDQFPAAHGNAAAGCDRAA